MKQIKLILGNLFLLLVAIGNASAQGGAESGRSSVILTAQIWIKPDSIQSFIEICKPLIEDTRKESGCLKYELFQNPYQPNSFFFFEEYADPEAKEYHARQPYLAHFKKLREPMLLQAPSAKVYQASATR